MATMARYDIPIVGYDLLWLKAGFADVGSIGWFFG